jgi:hypothetical protein
MRLWRRRRIDRLRTASKRQHSECPSKLSLVKMRLALANRIEDVDRAGNDRNWPGACAVATDRTAAPPARPSEDRQVLDDDKDRGSWRIVIILVVVPPPRVSSLKNGYSAPGFRPVV